MGIILEEDPLKLWQHIHGASVHFPLAMAICALIARIDADPAFFVIRILRWYLHWLIWGRFRSFEPPRIIAPPRILAEHRESFIRLSVIAGALISIPAVVSGLAAMNGWFGIEPWTAGRLVGHRNSALVGSILLIMLALLQAIVKEPPRWLTTLILVVSALAMGYAGFLGGYVARGY